VQTKSECNIKKSAFKKEKSGRETRLQRIQSKEEKISSEIQMISQRITDKTKEDENKKIKLEELKKQINSALQGHARDQSEIQKYNEQINYYKSMLDKLKSVLSSSSSFESAKSIQEFNYQDIIQAFSKIRSIEFSLQESFKNLSETQHSLQARCENLQKELEELKLMVSNIMDSEKIKEKAQNLTKNKGITYIDLLVNLDQYEENELTNTELEKYEKLNVFLVNFFAQKIEQVNSQLEFVNKNSQEKSNIVKSNVLSLFKINKDSLGSPKSLSRKKTQLSPVDSPTGLRRPKTLRTFAEAVENFKLLTRHEVLKFFLELFPGETLPAEEFSDLVLNNPIMKHFVNQAILEEFLAECEFPQEALKSIPKLIGLAFKSLKQKISEESTTFLDLLSSTNKKVKEALPEVQLSEIKETQKQLQNQKILTIIKTLISKNIQNLQQPQNLEQEFKKFVSKFQFSEFAFKRIPETTEKNPSKQESRVNLEIIVPNSSSKSKKTKLKPKTPNLPKIQTKTQMLTEFKKLEADLTHLKRLGSAKSLTELKSAKSKRN